MAITRTSPRDSAATRAATRLPAVRSRAWRAAPLALAAAAIAVGLPPRALAQQTVAPDLFGQPPGVPEAPSGTPPRYGTPEQRSQRRALTLLPSITVEETYTDNVRLEPDSSRKSDFVTQLIPSLRISERGTRTSLAGFISAPIQFYAKGNGYDRVVPDVELAGSVEAVERFFFVDASVHVAKDYFSPFGVRSVSSINQPGNQYTSQSYSISPYVRRTYGNLQYEVRDNNTWTNLSNAPISLSGAYTNQLLANVTRAAIPLGWALDYERTDVKFTGQQSQITELGRGRGIWRPDSRYELSASLGYENNRYPLTDYSNVTYGVSGRWRPTERTRLDAGWEHRFFGSSYQFSLDHRTPLTVWNLSAVRRVTSFPQQLAALPAGAFVPLLLDSLFASRIPDPIQRADFVLNFMRDRGLPVVLGGPLNLYNQQIFLEERAAGRVGLIGAQNSVFLSVWRLRTEPISAGGVPLPPDLGALNNNTQTGADVSWTHNISGSLVLSTHVNYYRTARRTTRFPRQRSKLPSSPC